MSSSLGAPRTVEKFQRLEKIKELVDEGKDETFIANELNIPVITIRRNMKYLEDLELSDIASKDRSEKRAELYLELLNAATQAQELFATAKNLDKHSAARSAFSSWMETVQLRMRLYGLENFKFESYTQINNQVNQYTEKERVPKAIGEKIANMLKSAHEESVGIKENDTEIYDA